MRESGFRTLRRVPTLASEVGRRLREDTQEPEGFAEFVAAVREKLDPWWQSLAEVGAPAEDREAFFRFCAAHRCPGADASTRERLAKRYTDELSPVTMRLLAEGAYVHAQEGPAFVV